MSSDRFFPQKVDKLLKRILSEEKSGSIFGIDKQFFFKPDKSNSFKENILGRELETPFGLAAGPHTQLAQNIISGWLAGARFIELKTIQVLDTIEVSKPCIDMRDEGYNCEWSQELTVEESLNEYLKAWILIHILKTKFEGETDIDTGTIFNMSAGYDLKGIRSGKVRNFIEKMRDCSAGKEIMIEKLSGIYPEITSLKIPESISDSITISTMHGTPPEEIEAIGNFFISEMGLNTVLKLNPTLLGPEQVRHILNDLQGFGVEVPDSAFEHDPKFEEGVEIVNNLKRLADSKNLFFGVKLTNTLESVNRDTSLPESEDRVYLSGRALHPVAVTLAQKLREAVGNGVNISFSAGADTFNIRNLISAGLKPVTVASDILKPGGYTRLYQYVEVLRKNGGITYQNDKDDTKQNLKRYRDEVLQDQKYKSDLLKKPLIKGRRRLDLFDCIYPPCMEECAASQDIPGYLKLTSANRFQEAYSKVFETNPFPTVTGLVCDHKCQTRCIREFYDESIKIKDIKYFLSGNSIKTEKMNMNKDGSDLHVGIIGAGPAGLTCAHSLSESGVNVTVYEESSKVGGMVENVIPPFRLEKDSLASDFDKLNLENVNIRFGARVNRALLDRLKKENNFIFFAAGAKSTIKLAIKGIDAKGVIYPLGLLSGLKSGIDIEIGNNVAVIGGGNTAFDVARSVKKFIGENGKVTILYRRSFKEMPAEAEEIRSAISEGIDVSVLTAPEKVVVKDGSVEGLICFRTELSDMGKGGRPYPKKIEGSEFLMPFDMVVPALGQRPDIESFGLDPKKIQGYKNILIDGNVVLGGDCGNGDKTVVNAIGDGRKAAEFILGGISLSPGKVVGKDCGNYSDLIKKRAVRIYSKIPKDKNIDPEHAIEESSRCLQCDKLCDICVTVCPNRANISLNGKTGLFSVPGIDKDSGDIIYRKFEIKQNHQIVNITDFCNHCGNCTTFCPTSGEPFRDKPRLALSMESFKSENDVFTLLFANDRKSIIRKRDSNKENLYSENGKIFYSGKDVNLILNEEDLKVEKIERKSENFPEIDSESLFALIYLFENLPDYLF